MSRDSDPSIDSAINHPSAEGSGGGEGGQAAGEGEQDN